MQSEVITPEGLIKLTTEGVLDMRGLLTPDECDSLKSPQTSTWSVEEPDSQTGRTWSHSPQYRFGSQISSVNTYAQRFMHDFRGAVNASAKIAKIPELEHWGHPVNAEYPLELIGLKRISYSAKWHQTPPGHEIGWHSDDSYSQLKARNQFGIRALGMMVAINLTKLGGDYEYAPAEDPNKITKILNVGQGDAVAFCTARNSSGQRWPGSFPLHRFKAHHSNDQTEPNQCRESMVMAFQDVSDRSIRTIGMAGIILAVKNRLPRL